VSLKVALGVLLAFGLVCYAVTLWLGFRDAISLTGMMVFGLSLVALTFVSSCLTDSLRFWGYGLVIAAVSAGTAAFLTFVLLAALFAPGALA
jgi:hypothetical protein